MMSTSLAKTLKSVRFEVFGRVQGVFFRKNTRDTAQKKQLVGWVQNTSRGTVVGVVQGEESQVDTMKHWLASVGSPRSKIDRCVFSREKSIPKTEYAAFSIKK